MKKLHRGMLLVLLCLSISFSNCYQTQRAFDGILTPNCKQFSVGSICFHNPSGKTTKVEIEDTKLEVLAFSTLCMDLYQGDYEYKVKNDRDKWKAEVGIRSCKEEKVELKKCESC
ncbi:MAG: hypothetical protein AAGJ18_08405 [Bacteroidota bacterium]